MNAPLPPDMATPPPPPPRRRIPLLRPRQERDPGGLVGGLVAWTVIALVIAGMAAMAFVVSRSAEQVPAEELADTVPPPTFVVESTAKLAPIVKTESEKQQVRWMLGITATEPADQLRAALAIDAMDGPEPAIGQIDAVIDSLGDEPAGQLADDLAAFRIALSDGPDALDEATRTGLIERHGWTARLALTRHLKPDDPARKAVIGKATRSYMIQAVFSLAIIGIAVLSFILFITAIVLVALGVIRCRLVPPVGGGSVYLETFAWFMILFVGVSFLADRLAPLLGPWTLAVQWLMLAALAWPMLRGIKWRDARQRLGWTSGTNFVVEMFLGAIGYIALLPILGVGVILTFAAMAIGGLFADPSDPGGLPSHPLPDMLSQAGTIEIVLIVTLATLWAPIVEESFFRGALYHHLRGRLGPILSGLTSGFIFAALHPQGIFGIPALMAAGLIFGLLREWRGTLLAPMTAHALNNGFITLMILLLIG